MWCGRQSENTVTMRQTLLLLEVHTILGNLIHQQLVWGRQCSPGQPLPMECLGNVQEAVPYCTHIYEIMNMAQQLTEVRFPKPSLVLQCCFRKQNKIEEVYVSTIISLVGYHRVQNLSSMIRYIQIDISLQHVLGCQDSVFQHGNTHEYTRLLSEILIF